MLKQSVKNELRWFSSAAECLEFAHSPESALHNQFEWDDSLAAYQYSLLEATGGVPYSPLELSEPVAAENYRLCQAAVIMRQAA